MAERENEKHEEKREGGWKGEGSFGKEGSTWVMVRKGDLL